MIKMPYRMCLLATLSVLSCVVGPGQGIKGYGIKVRVSRGIRDTGIRDTGYRDTGYGILGYGIWDMGYRDTGYGIQEYEMQRMSARPTNPIFSLRATVCARHKGCGMWDNGRGRLGVLINS